MGAPVDPTRRALLAAAASLVVLSGPARALTRVQHHLFGSPIDLLLPARTPAAAARDVLAGLGAMHRRWNAWKPGDLGALNEALAAGRVHRTTPALVALIRGAAPLEEASQGTFNPAIGRLVGAWGFHADRLRDGGDAPASLTPWSDARPSLAQLALVGLDVRSRNRALQLDFGAYAKGVAIDWAFERLARRHGVHDALLNLGGNLGAMGHADGRAWRVGIRDPHGPGLAAWIETDGREAVVTSGAYERWRRLDDGRRVTHIIDPASGQPAPAFASVTVVHREAGRADAAATALLVAGPARWRDIARRMGVDQVLAIDAQGQREATPRLAARLRKTT
jgi:FAD:protein FMN transferase